MTRSEARDFRLPHPGRYDEHVTRTTRAVLHSKGATAGALRWAAFHRRLEDLPEALRPYVDRVARQAHRVTDEDMTDLERAGYSEDAIFEITSAAALGAAVMRLERGLIALHEAERAADGGNGGPVA